MNILIIYSLMIIVGFVLEVLSVKLFYYITKEHYKIHHFTFGKYFLLLLFPLLAILFASFVEGLTILKVFVFFAIIGDVMEFLIGWAYDKVVGQRLWTYHKYSIFRYTSFLSLPLWGILGIVFWLLANAVKI